MKTKIDEQIKRTKERLQADAEAIFCSNPIWAGKYAAAPEGAKRYFAAVFVKSLHAWIEQSQADWKEITRELTVDDWRYLSETSGNQMAKAFYKKAATAAHEQGSVELAGSPEILNPSVV